MSELTGLTINAMTGEEVVAPLLKEEIEFIEAFASKALEEQKAQEAKSLARESALAKLAKLGLTEAEIAAL
jgi:DNA-binding NarL/FixJ family response regulator